MFASRKTVPGCPQRPTHVDKKEKKKAITSSNYMRLIRQVTDTKAELGQSYMEEGNSACMLNRKKKLSTKENSEVSLAR